jgi:hypothetical protein
VDIQRKLAILADAAKYDASCASSGTQFAQLARWARHRLDRRRGYLPQLRPRRALHLAAEDPADQLLPVRLPLLREPRERATCRARASRSTRWCSSRSTSTGATASRACFCPAASSRVPDYTMEQVVEVARVLREVHDFRGYIHLKTIPDASRRAAAESRPLCRPAQHQRRDCRPNRRPRRRSRPRRTARPSGARWRGCGCASTTRARTRSRVAAKTRVLSMRQRLGAACTGAGLRAGRPEHADDRRRRCHRRPAPSSRPAPRCTVPTSCKRVYYSAFSPIPDAARPRCRLPRRR